MRRARGMRLPRESMSAKPTRLKTSRKNMTRWRSIARAGRRLQQLAEPRLLVDLADPVAEGVGAGRAVRLRPRKADLVQRGQDLGPPPQAPVAARRFPLALIKVQDQRAQGQVRPRIQKRP